MPLNNSYYYLAIDLASLSIPLIASFHKKLNFISKMKYFAPSNLIMSFIFIVWDIYFTKIGIWSFNSEYLIGFEIFGLPIEEWLFFICIPYACTFTYESLRYFKLSEKITINMKSFWLIIALILLIFSILNFNLSYTFSSYFLAGILLILTYYFTDNVFKKEFTITYLVCLIPFIIVNGLLTSIPIVQYNDLENLSFRFGSIPIEDTIYMLSMLLINIGLYEKLQNIY